MRTQPIAQAGDPTTYQRHITRLQADPKAYLLTVKQRCDRLDQYTVLLVRQERLGLFFRSLGPAERIRAKFRAHPLSIKFQWLDGNSQAAEAAFVQGYHDGRLLLLPRRGVFGGPPTVAKVQVEDPVRWGQARNPITDFGLARIMARTMDGLAQADRYGGAEVAHKGIVTLDETGAVSHFIEIRYPARPGFSHPLQHLFVDADTGLLAGIKLFLADGSLDLMYIFGQLTTQPRLTDADFRIEAPGDESARPAD